MYGKQYSQIINFEEYNNQEEFEKELIKLCNKYKAVCFDEYKKEMNKV